ncbi:MAG: aminomethyl-transferring glycine dehydrogenase [Planctomycetota bacterium]
MTPTPTAPAVTASASTDPDATAPLPELPSASPGARAGGFLPRHMGVVDPGETRAMLDAIGAESLPGLIAQVVPASVRRRSPMSLPDPLGEAEALGELAQIAGLNRVSRSMIGQGYYGTQLPPVIRRAVLENPLWYTPYTPYQAEIAQGRLEALLNFQTMVSELTGLPTAGASLLDEATAAAEAMGVCVATSRGARTRILAADSLHPQSRAVLATRARSAGWDLSFSPVKELASAHFDGVAGVIVQSPDTLGRVIHPDSMRALAERVHGAGALLAVGTDLLACCLTEPPGACGADLAYGTAQRFGMPIGGGGPHAAFFATTDAAARKMPGRIVGMAKDAKGRPALRLAWQTREQHIRRDKATSNICTAQALPAVVSSFYAVYHGPEGLRRIAEGVHGHAVALRDRLAHAGVETGGEALFDTVVARNVDADAALAKALEHGVNLRKVDAHTVCIACDETTTAGDVDAVARAVSGAPRKDAGLSATQAFAVLPQRTSGYLPQPVFHRYHGEHELLRYAHRLASRDYGLAHGMIPLGSCTMKLNAAAEMLPILWPAFANPHPYGPSDQTKGYQKLFEQLERWLAEVTGFDAVSLQPNAGSQGEYAGLLAIRGLHRAQGQDQRDACLIPTSAHGTNPASAVIAGLRVVPVACRDNGDIDLDDLRAKAAAEGDRVAALMITYPSTHGVFETGVREACDIVHAAGGRVYMDGANLNAQVGLTSPGDCGADVCHLNLHKTFCIPHGGGGPGMGPIACTAELAPYLPGHLEQAGDGEKDVDVVSAAPYGSPMILPISWMYMRMLGVPGLTEASARAILSANYLAARLRDAFPVLYAGAGGLVAHEFILDLRPMTKATGVTIEDVAKRLMDYGFHAPTMSWPVAGTLMVEPTESESLVELDRFVEAMRAIRDEADDIEHGRADRADNALKHAPHTLEDVLSDSWERPYGREAAGYPVPGLREPGRKLWPAVGRIDQASGDRKLICTCPTVEELAG